MMISTKGRYALRVMLDMAEHGGSEWHRLSDVAQRQQLSKKYLETIMAALSRANLVESAVGKSGGCRRRHPAVPCAPAAALPATATRGFSGRGWKTRSTAMSTIIRWRNSCELMKKHRPS